jgi:hypothetical protein
MNTGKHKIWICIKKRHIFIKLTDKKMDNIFAICRGKSKRSQMLANKRSRVKKALKKKELRLMAYMSSLNYLTFSEFMISEDLYMFIKGGADQLLLEYEREDYDEESMVF